MLTLKPEYQRVRAVVTGTPDAPGAALLTDDRMDIVRVLYDKRNRQIIVHLEIGAVSEDGAFLGSAVVRQAVLDARPATDPRQDNTWQQALDDPATDAFEKIENVIRKAALLDEVQRLDTDPPPPA